MGLTQELEWFVDDLVGDGWQVVQRTVLRHNKTELSSNMTHASELRDSLALEAEKAGHNPQPYEGDLYYADLGQQWAQNAKGVSV